MHIPLDGGHQNDPIVLGLIWVLACSNRSCTFLLLHERCQMRHGLLHHSCTFDDLWQEHLARTEEITNYPHSSHQRALDHQEWNFHIDSCLLNIINNVFVDAI